MGRHSAPDDDADDAALGSAESGLALLDLENAEAGQADSADTTSSGRHSWSGAADVGLLARTGPIERITDRPPVDAVTDTAPGGFAPLVPAGVGVADGRTPDAAAAAPPTRAPSGTRADLALLRTSPGLRGRAAAAVVVPIAIYAIVLAVIGKLYIFVYWVWIPIIVAGALFGLMLDLAARKANPPGADGSSED